MLALRFTEKTSGSLFLHAAPLDEKKVAAQFDFTLSLMPEALDEKTLALGGTIDIEGIAAARPHHGDVLVHWGVERRIRYTFAFTGDDGKKYRVVGQKDFFVGAPLASLTILPFSLYEDDFHEIGQGEVALKSRRDIFAAFKSVRVKFLAGLKREEIAR